MLMLASEPVVGAEPREPDVTPCEAFGFPPACCAITVTPAESWHLGCVESIADALAPLGAGYQGGTP
jgi:hypothetical protein